jgi:23S rRNA (cytosine1962-C5)-methyltransferase
MTKVTLNRKISQRVANGHPWVFANEVNRVDGNAEAGASVDVHTHEDKF